MRSKLDPMVQTEWHEYYRAAAQRRRHNGWHRRGEARKPKLKIDASKVLAIVMGLAAATVALCVVIPA